MNETYTVYRIVCFTTGKCYVGQAVNYKKRKQTHLTPLRGGYHKNQHLQRAFNLYGEKSFYFEALEKDIPQDQVNDREIFWIDHFDSLNNGYNKVPGGNSYNNYGISCTWNGDDYPSISAAARANNLNVCTLTHWLKLGFTCDAEVKFAPYNAKQCEWNGIIYNSITEAAKGNDKPVATLQKYVKAGHKSDNDVMEKTRPKKQKITSVLKSKTSKKLIPCEWNGKEYRSISEAARACDVSVSTMQYRLWTGYKCDSDVPGQNKPCVWKGVEYPSITAAASANGIEVRRMSWLVSAGHTSDENLRPTGGGKAMACMWNGTLHSSIKSAAKACKVSFKTMWYRVQRGYTCDDDLKIKRKLNETPKP